MASEKRYTVVGYRGCGFAERACRAVKDLAAEDKDVTHTCQMTSRSEYRAWLSAKQGLAANVPDHHRTSPSCFIGETFIGGCDELMNHVSGVSTKDSGTGCVTQ